MATNSVVLRVAQKEIQLLFSSAVAWLFLASFVVVTLFIFFWVESFFARNIADIRPLFEWMPILLIFLCAALTMRMWSEERHSGTLEHVLTQPVSVWHFVAGKFFACFTVLVLALISTLPLPITVALIANLDWGPVFGGYIAATLLGAAYLTIGLFVSARTDNPIISLIGTVMICALLYLVGSDTLTGFFDDRTGAIMRLFGSGSRFESITRGIVDLRDLFYYASLGAAFLIMNVYVLERGRWANKAGSKRQRYWRAITVLLLGNLVLANIWLDQLPRVSIDMTEGKNFSISQPTKDFLNRLQEPLLIRGYFSSKNHPLLAPLVPQIRDLLDEYALAGGGKVRVEFIDPADSVEVEQEANERYGISARPFQIADRHQSSLVNAYFNVLVRYGSEHQSLNFSDLIEVRVTPNEAAEVRLRNPEYDITHAIKKVLFDYRMGGNLFDGIEGPVELIGYVSADTLLPDSLQAYKKSIIPQLELAARNSQGKFSIRFIEPESRDGVIAADISTRWGFKPMVVSAEEPEEFFFYLTLADSRQVVQLPTDKFDPTEFRLVLDAGLKRFAPGFTKIVALSVPHVDSQMTKLRLGGPTFSSLERMITKNYSIRLEDLSDGHVAPEADILAVVAPRRLNEQAIFAIDQFLMRGGTVVLATSPFTAEITADEIRLQDWDSGLQQWLEHNGLNIQRTLVLDKQSARFYSPVARKSGGHTFQDRQIIDYPYFIDLRTPGLEPEHIVTRKLPQLTMALASPILVVPDVNRKTTVLLRSSKQSWLSDNMNITPSSGENGVKGFELHPNGNDETKASVTTSKNLGVIVQGRFDSFFAEGDPPQHTQTRAEHGSPLPSPRAQALLKKSPESARVVLYASNDFMDDQILNSIIGTSGTQYLGPLELFMNTLDWALRDEQLLEIRSRGHFNRTLPSMERRGQIVIEYFNYGLALLWLLLLALINWLNTVLQRRNYARGLSQ